MDKNFELQEGKSITALPSFSIVVEWENVRLAEFGRARKMLCELFRQLQQEHNNFTDKPEIILVYDPDKISSEKIGRAIESEYRSNKYLATLSFVEGRNLDYFRAKNLGAQHTHGDIIIFLDSDVVPEDGWLSSIVSPFKGAAVDVVCGRTYITTEGLYDSACALFWQFPLRDPCEGLVEVEISSVFSNNIAFRRHQFVQMPFPDLDQFRGHGRRLLQEMKSAGRGIYLQNSARCAHPPPNGFYHFVCRAICDGYDDYMRATQYKEFDGRPPLKQSFWTLRRWLPSVYNKIFANRHIAKVSAAGTALSLILAIFYGGFMTLGNVLTRMSPVFVRRYFSM